MAAHAVEHSRTSGCWDYRKKFSEPCKYERCGTRGICAQKTYFCAGCAYEVDGGERFTCEHPWCIEAFQLGVQAKTKHLAAVAAGAERNAAGASTRGSAAVAAGAERNAAGASTNGSAAGSAGGSDVHQTTRDELADEVRELRTRCQELEAKHQTTRDQLADEVRELRARCQELEANYEHLAAVLQAMQLPPRATQPAPVPPATQPATAASDGWRGTQWGQWDWQPRGQ